MTEVAEIERSEEDMTVSEGTRSDPIRPLTDDSANAMRDSNLRSVPPIVISSDEAPDISARSPRSPSHDMPRRAASAQPVRRSPRLRARAAASANLPATEPASPPDEISKGPASTDRPSTKTTPPTRPTEPSTRPTAPSVPNRPAVNNSGGPDSNIPEMAEVDPRDQEVYCAALDTWFPAPSLYDDLDPASHKNAEYFADAPWFRRDVCTNHREILENYTDRNGRLPGGIPLVGTEKWTWLNQFTYTKEALHVVDGRNKTSVVGEMAITINRALKRFFTYEVPASNARPE